MNNLDDKKKREKLLYILNNFEIYIGAVIFIAITILLTLQVFSRFVLNHSITWTEEVASILYVWMIYLGVAAAVGKRKHLRIDAFIDSRPFKLKRALYIFTNLIFMFFCVYIFPPIMQVISNLRRTAVETNLLRIPKWITYMIIPVCLVLTFIRLIQEIIRLSKETETELGKSVPTIDCEALEREYLESLKGREGDH